MWKWEAAGQPKAVVVIVHNVFEHHRRYAWLIQMLRNHDFHVVTSDLPGHGSTDRMVVHDQSFDAYRSHVKKMIDVALLEQLPLFIIAHGFGATIVIDQLQREKLEIAGVILSSPWFAMRHQPAKLTSVLTKISPSLKLNQDFPTQWLTRNAEAYEELLEDRAYCTTVTASWYHEMTAMMKMIGQVDQKLQDVPLLLQTGGEDRITHIEVARDWLMQQSLSEFHYKQWKLLYHDLYHEPEREEVYYFLQTFMHQVLRSIGYAL